MTILGAEWQPFKTAPRDREIVVVRQRKNLTSSEHRFRWHHGEEYWQQLVDGMWQRRVLTPTHWREKSK